MQSGEASVKRADGDVSAAAPGSTIQSGAVDFYLVFECPAMEHNGLLASQIYNK
jgi:hypothetical protein